MKVKNWLGLSYFGLEFETRIKVVPCESTLVNIYFVNVHESAFLLVN